MKFSHPLMHNNFTKSDMIAARKLFKGKNIILTQSKKVQEFERKWSKWLGVKYSIFVNSGSSANLLTMAALRILYKKNEIIVPTLTWVSDINSIIQIKHSDLLISSIFCSPFTSLINFCFL